MWNIISRISDKVNRNGGFSFISERKNQTPNQGGAIIGQTNRFLDSAQPHPGIRFDPSAASVQSNERKPRRDGLSPDLKSVSFFASQLPLYADPVFGLDRQIQGINVPDADLYMPIEEAKSRLHDPRFVIPYSRAVKQQMLDGKITEPVNDKKFIDKFKAIVDKIVG